MSKTWEVFIQSSEPEVHVKNVRQTKKYKTGQKVNYVYINIKKKPKNIVILGKFFNKLFSEKKKH